MDSLRRRKFFFLIALSLGFVAFTWSVPIPAGGEDHRSHQPGIAHPHRHSPDGPVSDTNGAPPILFTPSQAEEITLRFARAEERRMEKWVRTAGKSDPAKQALEGRVFGPEARLIQRGQQVRIFPLAGTGRMLQGKVTGITLNHPGQTKLATPKNGNGLQRDPGLFTGKSAREDPWEAWVQVSFRDRWHREAHFYVMEIIVPLGNPLSIPHEAIIEEAGEKIVFVRDGKNRCQRRRISVGTRGEIYDEVLSGLQEGEEVATWGSFFLDAEYQLKFKRVFTRHHPGEKP